MTFPTNIVTPLHGHTSEATAYTIADYPYGFKLRCRYRCWLETNKNGTRFVSQTTNPKRPGEVWNKPKASTYVRFVAGMYLDDAGHVHWIGISEYSSAEEVRSFLEHWPEHRAELRTWCAQKAGFAAKLSEFNRRGESGFLVNGEVQACRPGDLERHLAEFEVWKALADDGVKRKTLGDVKKELGEAIEKGDTKTARPILDRLRRNGWGPIEPFTYDDLFAFARDAKPGLERSAWDAFLAEIDSAESREDTSTT